MLKAPKLNAMLLKSILVPRSLQNGTISFPGAESHDFVPLWSAVTARLRPLKAQPQVSFGWARRHLQNQRVVELADSSGNSNSQGKAISPPTGKLLRMHVL
jgi:hypothetical protein